MATASKGNCYLCGAELGKTAIKNHILKKHSEGEQECVLLKIEGAYEKNYWLYVDIPPEKTLSALDRFLRDIWLECCGHMSAFRAAKGGWGEDIGKCRKISSFEIGEKIVHEYDFGSTTETLITFVDKTKRPPQRDAVRLLARNVPPKFPCADCGAEAAYIDTEAMYDAENPFFCEKCAKSRDEDMLLPVTNSPRMGVCGYCGERDRFGFSSPPFGDERP